MHRADPYHFCNLEGYSIAQVSYFFTEKSCVQLGATLLGLRVSQTESVSVKHYLSFNCRSLIFKNKIN